MIRDTEINWKQYIAARIAEIDEEKKAPEKLHEVVPMPDGGTLVNGQPTSVSPHQVLETNDAAYHHETTCHTATPTDALTVFWGSDSGESTDALLFQATAPERIQIYDNPLFPQLKANSVSPLAGLRASDPLVQKDNRLDRLSSVATSETIFED